MNIGDFLQGWNNPSRYGIKRHEFTVWGEKPLTSGGLYAARHEVFRNDYVFRIEKDFLYAQVTARFECEPQNIKKVWIKQLFEEMPDFPIPKRRNPLEGVKPNPFKWEESQTYGVTIHYGDPYKLGGFSNPFSGTPESIKIEVANCGDYMYEKMGRNGCPYSYVSFDGQTWNRQLNLTMPGKGATGLWIRRNVHLMDLQSLNPVANQVFMGEGSHSCGQPIHVNDLLKYIDDSHLYKSSTPDDQPHLLPGRSFTVC